MLVKNVVRGNMVTFSSSFYDGTNTLVAPSDPKVTLYYKSNSVYVTVTSNLSISTTNTWIGTWNSSNADVGIVEWHISAGAGTPIAEDGEFRILSNRANGGVGAT